jgi:hypothetical protein
MTFGFPAYAVDEMRFELASYRMTETVLKTLEALSWRCESVSPDEIVAKISANIFSWGERLRVRVAEDGTVTARSESVLPTQCIDWGKNRRNVLRFFGELERSVASAKTLIASERPRDQFDREGRTPVERIFDGAGES